MTRSSDLVAQPITSPVLSAAPQVSFVIPALNEERVLPPTLRSIHRVMSGHFTYEIVVVDNGSTDRTVAVARDHGARVLALPSGSIASVRNAGARQCSAPVLVFLDADVVLTDAWGENIGATLGELARRPMLLTGSLCSVPENPSWLERFWFAPLQNGRNTHINSGHIILQRTLFEQLGGFDDRLETGEDYDFSARALQMGAELEQKPSLVVVHYGYPRSVRSFVRREIWHGRSDFVSLRAMLHSKIAMATILFLALHAMFVASIVMRHGPFALGSAVGMALTCTMAAIGQYRTQPYRVVLVNILIYYFYFLGRSIALLRALTPDNSFIPRDRR